MLIPWVLAVLHVMGGVRLAPLDWLDRQIEDARTRATLNPARDDRIVILDIDESSLAQVGRWPWSRWVLADLVNRLFAEHRIAVLGFDMVFPEPETNVLAQLLGRVPPSEEGEVTARLRALAAQADADQAFARSLANRPVVLGHYFTSDRQGHRTGQLPAPLWTRSAPTGSGPAPAWAQAPMVQWTGFGANLPRFMDQARDGGFFNSLIDSDGLVRSVPLLSVMDGQVHQSFALAVFRATQPDATVEVVGAGPSGTGPGIDRLLIRRADQSWPIPVDERVSTRIPFRGVGGPQGNAFRYVSVADVLSGSLTPGELDGKIVLLGTTAPGLWDIRATPVSPTFPGVEVHANLIAGFLDGTTPIRPDYAMGYELAVVIASGLLLWGVLPWLSVGPAVLFLGGLLAGVVGLNTWLHAQHHLVLPLAASVFMVVTAFVLSMAHGYVTESRAKRRLANLFGTYVPPELVDEMVKSPHTYTMKAQVREVTVMFCDIHGFTAMAEKLSPDQIQALLNHVLSELSSIIRQHRGTIDKYMGDCVMAFWGAPVDDPDHAIHAVQAAQAMVHAMDRINAHGQTQGWPVVKIGIGLNTGSVSVGDMGSDNRRAYTVVGDAVNIAARLEPLTRTLGIDILVSAATVEGCTSVNWRQLEPVTLKGKSTAVAVLTPVLK